MGRALHVGGHHRGTAHGEAACLLGSLLEPYAHQTLCLWWWWWWRCSDVLHSSSEDGVLGAVDYATRTYASEIRAAAAASVQALEAKLWGRINDSMSE